MTKRILLLSGTSEGPPLARALLTAGCAVRATVTRAEAIATLFGSLTSQMVVEKRGFTEASLTDFLRSGEVDLVLDATHPFAVRITRMAHGVCSRLGMPYVRYERPDWVPPLGTRFAATFAEAAQVLPTLGSRALLTIGCKQLKYFAHLHKQMTLFARILPSDESEQKAREHGFPPDRLLCQRPPFTREENRAVFKRLDIDVLVTKASGQEGGVVEKVLAAVDLGITVLMICRPELPKIPSVHTIDAAVEACLARLRNPGVSAES